MGSDDKPTSENSVMLDYEKTFDAEVNIANEEKTIRESEEIKKINEEFVSAAQGGNLSLVEQLLSSKRPVVDVDFKTGPKEQSAISEASENGHEDVVRLLLSHNCDIHTRSNIGSTPLLFASWRGHIEVVRVLVAAGADPDS